MSRRERLLGRTRWSHRWAVRVGVALAAVVATAVAAIGTMVAIDRAFFVDRTQLCARQASRMSRPAMQRILDGVVGDPSKLAPGATAYVAGPHGSWSGAAGVADTSTCARMPVDARMRLESVTKIYTAALILQLAQDGKLHVGDTVADWLPGLLPYGDRITIRELLTMSSGLIDNNDLVNAPPDVRDMDFARVKDVALRAQLRATLARAEKDRASVVPVSFWIRWAAWQPLLFTPGSGRHYSNIGFDILGLIGARAAGEPLAALYRERIFRPLGLHATAYDPQGAIRGPHAEGYGIDPGGTQTRTTDWHWGVGAEGGIVSNAQDTARFLTALMRGRLLDRRTLAQMKGDSFWRGGTFSPCSIQAYGWSGGGDGYKTNVWVDRNGGRVAVLLLNARHYNTAQLAADQTAQDTLARLYCGA